MRLAFPAAGFVALLLAAAAALAGSTREVRGQISSLDTSGRTLVVREALAPRREVRLTLRSGAQIVEGGKPASLGDLATGERVKVTYAERGTAHEAMRVEILAAKAAERS